MPQKMSVRNSIVAAAVCIGICVPGARADRFIAGADISGLPFFESRGKQYRDESGNRDAIDILKSHGVNFIRLRLETSSQEQAKADPYSKGNNLAYTLPLAVHVSRAGLPWMLDFFYSDTWADPGHQSKPHDWKGLDLDQLNQRMYEYNRDTIAAFRKAGAMPSMVQVGNEITSGMLWPEARTDTPEHWANLARLIKSAIRGIRESSGDQMPKIVIHIDRGDKRGVVRWFFDHLRAQQVDFDVIGLSYYPDEKSKLSDLEGTLDDAATRYGCPVLIAETAFPAVGRERGENAAIDGIEPSPEGQATFVRTLCRLVKRIPEGRGLGVFWWGTEYQPVANFRLGEFDRRSMFDADGRVRPAIDALGQAAVK